MKPPRRYLTRQAWWPRPGGGITIDVLLEGADAAASLVERHIWLIRLLDWIRRGEPVSGTQYIVRMLEEDPVRRAKVVSLLAAFWRDVDVSALLADYGFAPRVSFINELGERLRLRLLPATPDTSDLATLFNLLFDDPHDVRWMAALDGPTVEGIAAIWREAVDQAGTSPLGWREPFYEAMLYLVGQVRATGFSREFRPRVGVRMDADFDGSVASIDPTEVHDAAVRDASVRSAFRNLTHVAERVHELAEAHAHQVRSAPLSSDLDVAAPSALLQETQYLRALLDTCAKATQGVHGHLEAHGISIDIVFQIDQLVERCRRIEQLLDAVLAPEPTEVLRHTLIELVQVGLRRRSVRALFARHYSMLARKMAERSAATGEHYITRSRAEYAEMLRRAGGGGAIMAGTTFMKFALLAIGLSPFWTGLSAGLNYAISFVLIQWLNFTVATKQPAMTAPAMAAKLADTVSDEAVEDFVDEVARLIRSQVAGIVGNLSIVAPVVLAAQLAAWELRGRPLIDRHSALHVLDKLTLWGPSLWYAAFTGVLLFTASMIAGWVENWFVLHRLDSALRWNPSIRDWLGEARAARWADWWRHNISALAANVSLGMMLGLVPVIAGFFALPLDVRHVTLSTGQLAAALGTLGQSALHNPSFWWGVAAVPLTGLLNVSVSFVLALRVAVRSRGVRVRDRARLQSALWRRLRRHPFSFLFPPRDEAGGAS